MSAKADGGSPLRAWSWQHAVARSSLAPTTKAVLYALALFMDATGQSCFPKIERSEHDDGDKLDLVTATGLSKRAVIEHLKIAEDGGWLVRRNLGLRGQRWRQNEYAARWPGRELAADEADAVSPEGGDPAAPASPGEVVTLTTEAGDPDDTKLVTVVHQDKNQSSNQSTTSPSERDARAREGQKSPPEREAHLPHADLLAALRAKAPTVVADDWAEVEAQWRRLTPEERRDANARYPEWLEALRKLRRGTIAGLATYLRDRRWEALPGKAEIAEAQQARADAFGRLWWWLFHEFCQRYAAALTDPAGSTAAELRRRVSAAKSFGGGWPIDPAQRADLEERAKALRQVPVDGDDARAWRGWYRGRGLDLPLPDKVAWLFVPAAFPGTGPPQEARSDGNAGATGNGEQAQSEDVAAEAERPLRR